MDLSFDLGEYFCGPGGLARGAHDAAESISNDPSLGHHVDVRHRWAVDIDHDTCLTYRRNIPGATRDSVITDDVRGALDRHDLSDIDGFAFGFPCNDFSLVGEHKGFNGSYGGLYETGIQVLRRRQPQWFIAENVGGIRSANEGKAFALIMRELAESGYRTYPHLYKFEQYGVPQARHRVIIVGIRGDLDTEYRVPSPTLYEHIDVSARSALEREYPAGTENRELPTMHPRVVGRLELIDPGENAFNAKRMTDEFRLNVRGATISQIYKRLQPDKPSYTVTGSGGGGTHVYHWKEPRALTNRERARLQTFPDDFEFRGNRTSVRRQVGMAVPVDGAAAIFRALFLSFLRVDYPSVQQNIAVETRRSGNPVLLETPNDVVPVTL